MQVYIMAFKVARVLLHDQDCRTLKLLNHNPEPEKAALQSKACKALETSVASRMLHETPSLWASELLQKQPGIPQHELYGGFQNQRYFFEGPCNEDSSIWGSILGPPIHGTKTTISEFLRVNHASSLAQDLLALKASMKVLRNQSWEARGEFKQ